MDLTSHLYNPQFHRGACTTRPANAKKIDLDPMSRRTINPEYNQEVISCPKPRKILQPSNILNQDPFLNLASNSKENQVLRRPSTPKVNMESQRTEVPVKRVLK